MAMWSKPGMETTRPRPVRGQWPNWNRARKIFALRGLCPDIRGEFFFPAFFLRFFLASFPCHFFCLFPAFSPAFSLVFFLPPLLLVVGLVWGHARMRGVAGGGDSETVISCLIMATRTSYATRDENISHNGR